MKLLPSAPSAAASSPGAGRMLWPVSGRVSSPFGKRGRRSFHAGIDIPMPKGTPIRAAQAGVVTEVIPQRSKGFRGYGNVVIVDHGKGISTLYAHCLSFKVKKGQHVRQGDVLATVGRTGRATTNHLHFEVRLHGRPVNPIKYLPSRS
ncbi:MAG: M23 family metallopeptidase [Fretibacterium sp.]|nr:M23 family metallopeptidase [Fretibacterium sp.]